MNAIQKAIDEIKYRIPKAVLEKVFIQRRFDWRQTVNSNIDDQILVNVIRPRVLVDCNLVGGTQAMIPLDGLAFAKPNDFTTVIHVPKSRTQGRSINSVLNLAFLSPGVTASWAGGGAGSAMGQFNSGENSAAMGAAIGMMAAVDKIPIVSTSNVQLIAENTVMIRDVISIPSNGFLRCILANDEDLNHLQPRSYLQFSKLVEYAVKSYIYNELIINIDTAELQGGQQLGIFKTVLDGYSDAEQNYQDYLRDTWEAVAIMSDSMSYNRLIKLTIGGNR
jgi:hypothetical protein